MKHIVYDCDNTFGVRNCDVDDGLAQWEPMNLVRSERKQQ